MKTKKAKKSRNRVDRTKMKDLHEYFTSEVYNTNALDFLPMQTQLEILKNRKNY
jgi:hypothetical protein